ncbi:MAG: TolC family protein, partial [Flavisolibacter sp.]|nr:TolC family protein [Flavisolibacter sp.]
YRSSLDKLNTEVLHLDEKDIELNAERRALLQVLSQFMGKRLSDSVHLQIPAESTMDATIRRPELRVFESQHAIYDAQQQLLHRKIWPKLSLFVQTGIGRPALNMLRNDLRPYYIAGIRLNWNISNLYIYQKENEILELSKQMTAVQKQTFLFNTQVSLQQQTEEVKKYEDLLQVDEKILALRASIKKTALTQLENGVITVNDYLKEVFNEQSAREQQQLHKLQRLQAQYRIKTTSGI